MKFANVDLANIFNLLPVGGGTFFSESYYMEYRNDPPSFSSNKDVLQLFIVGRNTVITKKEIVNTPTYNDFHFNKSGFYKINLFFIIKTILPPGVKSGPWTLAILNTDQDIIHRVPVIGNNTLIDGEYYSTFKLTTYYHFLSTETKYSFACFTDINSPSVPEVQYRKYPLTTVYLTPEGRSFEFNLFLIKPD